MPNENEPILYEAAELKVQLNKLHEEYDMLIPLVIERVRKLCKDKEKEQTKVGEMGTFNIGVQSNWIFSAKVQALNGQLVDLKRQEQADGTAKVEKKDKLIFNVKN